MSIRTLELIALAMTFFAVQIGALLLADGELPRPWDEAAMAGWAAGVIFGGLAVLSLFGFPKSGAGENDEDEDGEEARPYWKHVRLWQLGLGLGIPFLLYADAVTGDTGNFNRMAQSWAFWPGIAGVGYVGLLIVWRILVAIFGSEGEELQPTTHGSARFATDKEIRKAGLTQNGGAYIGQYPDLTDEGLWYNGDGHLITVASSGSGKGVSAIIPNLLTWEGSVICNDPKGENAAITARRRQEMGQEVYVLNPWGLHVGEPWNLHCAAFNPLDWLDTESEDVGDDATMMANTIVLRDKGTSGVEGHFADEAESLLTGLILYVAFTEHDPLRRNLVTVRRLLVQPPEDWADTLKAMARAPYADGLIASAANRFLSKSDREGPAVLSTAQRHTNFLDSNRMRQVLGSSDFDLADLKRKPMTIYLCLPFDQVGGQASRWLRLMITLSLTALSRTKGPVNPGVLFLLDEFAALGPMRMAERAMAEGRGYGVRMWPILQDLNQLKDSYKDGWQTFIGNARVVQFFGTADVFTAEYVSKMLGKTTVWSSGSSGNRESTSETGRALMTPDEVMHLGVDEELLFVRGVRPIRARKVPYFHSNLNELADPNPMMAHGEPGEAV
ncbi:MAG: type IV secretory system conjugative DNA transfer family protein [Alphaproteobacteria bacterium]|nr:type IV secretory system conjugative DNA transfer family protein [Alphaproteobacteria bacterium]